MSGDGPDSKAALLRAPRRGEDRGAARRAMTREQICKAANRLFATVGYAAATMDQIANAAEIRRSTLYTHFADKEQILEAIGENYVIDVCDVIRRLPGPAPSDTEIGAWVADFADFVTSEPAPAELIMAVGMQPGTPQATARFGATMMRCFAEQFIAFERALQPGEGFRLAWAQATLAELGHALTHRARHGDDQTSRDRLAVATMLFGRFLREER
ncbi:TetR/AcrR family transcriptional regulator [Sphingomonas crocodyli]|uniref:TetR/AcrR family transcriptional regulator n=1 Tax=Sphingomonas crocodyli TaxID=1979270 RepID=A0A437LY06_9SPHN|nr:TetR/AcrR family transcriptional regulator [Sphingomonas crocodyli]RVT90280.1 TetR/AcrR family transcriptional regulator [Sphingomonas crocodyli]